MAGCLVCSRNSKRTTGLRQSDGVMWEEVRVQLASAKSCNALMGCGKEFWFNSKSYRKLWEDFEQENWFMTLKRSLWLLCGGLVREGAKTGTAGKVLLQQYKEETLDLRLGFTYRLYVDEILKEHETYL